MLFRNENPNLGVSTTVQEVGLISTSSASTSAFDLKPTTRQIINTRIAAADTAGYIFEAPWACQVIAVRFNCTVVAGSSDLMGVYKLTADSVAPGSGTLILAATFNLNSDATANTRVNIALSTTLASLQMAAGDQLAFNIAAAPTSLVGALLQVEVKQLG